MESSKTEQERLQMFFDGELSPEEEAAVREGLRSSPEQAAQLAEWERVRGAVRGASGRWAEELDSDALFARIEAELQAPRQSTPPWEEPIVEEKPPLRVVPGGRERRVWGGMATGLAAAAAILLAVLAWPAEQAPPEIARGSEVVAVDFGDYAGTVFEIEGGAGQSLSVVWISDEEVAIP